MNYYEIVLISKVTQIKLYYPSVKGLKGAKRHASKFAKLLANYRAIYTAQEINIYYVNKSADIRELKAQRLKGEDWQTYA